MDTTIHTRLKRDVIYLTNFFRFRFIQQVQTGITEALQQRVKQETLKIKLQGKKTGTRDNTYTPSRKQIIIH